MPRANYIHEPDENTLLQFTVQYEVLVGAQLDGHVEFEHPILNRIDAVVLGPSGVISRLRWLRGCETDGFDDDTADLAEAQCWRDYRDELLVACKADWEEIIDDHDKK